MSPVQTLPNRNAPRSAPRGVESKPIEPVLEVTLGDPVAVRTRAELSAGNFRGAEELFDTITDPNDRAFYADVLADWQGYPPWLDAWLEATPRSVAAHLVRGVHGLHWAWQARGMGYADSVNEDAAETFVARLKRADANLQIAARMASTDATPWAFMLRAARGLELDLDEIRQRFEQARRRAPEHRLAHSQMLQSLCAKWYGSHEQMFEFARQAAASAARGSPLHALVAEAHIERWLSLHEEPDQQAAYFADGAVRADLQHAANVCLAGLGPKTERDALRTRNCLACCLWCVGDRPAAAAQFKAIGAWVTAQPWNFWG